jgi:hypothetical protein
LGAATTGKVTVTTGCSYRNCNLARVHTAPMAGWRPAQPAHSPLATRPRPHAPPFGPKRLQLAHATGRIPHACKPPSSTHVPPGTRGTTPSAGGVSLASFRRSAERLLGFRSTGGLARPCRTRCVSSVSYSLPYLVAFALLYRAGKGPGFRSSLSAAIRLRFINTQPEG